MTDLQSKFEQMLKLEDDARVDHCTMAFGDTVDTRWYAKLRYRRTIASLGALMTSLTPEELTSYFEYRRSLMAEVN